jgi:hypothetical protein
MTPAEPQAAPETRDDEAFAQRLEYLLDLFDTRKSAARVAGKSVDQLQAYLKGRSAVPLHPIARLCAAKGVSLDWLVAGSGASERAQDTHPGDSPGAQAAADGSGAGTVLVPPYETGREAGARDRAAGPGRVALPAALVEQVLRRPPEHLASLVAVGDAMAPTIHDGDLVVLDTGDRALADGCLYALKTERQPILRRVARQASGGIRLTAEGPGIADELVSAADTRRLSVIGRVVWAGSPR